MSRSPDPSTGPNRAGDTAPRPAWHRALDAADRVTGAIAAALAWAGAAVLVGITGVIFYAVVRRYVFGAPVTWTDELASYAVVLMVMIGAADATRRHENVEVDLLTARAGPRLARLAAIWGCLAVLVVAGALLHGGWEMVSFARMVGLISDGYLEIPMWIPQAAMPAGMAVLILVVAVRLVRLLTGVEAPHHGRQSAAPPDPDSVAGGGPPPP